MNTIGTGWKCCYWLVPTWYLAVTFGFLLLLLPTPPRPRQGSDSEPCLSSPGRLRPTTLRSAGKQHCTFTFIHTILFSVYCSVYCIVDFVMYTLYCILLYTVYCYFTISNDFIIPKSLIFPNLV